MEESSSELVFENDGTGSHMMRGRIHVQSDSGLQRFAVLSFPYQSLTESMELRYVRVRKPGGTLVITPPQEAQDIAAETTRQAPLYSDLREKHIAVKGLSVGDMLEYEIHVHITKALAAGQFWCAYTFANDGIVLQENFKVDVPLERAVKWRSPNIQPTITYIGKRRMFAWTSSLLVKKSKDQEKAEQQIAIYQGSQGKFPQPEIQLSSFRSWGEVGRWYSGLQEKRATPTEEIRVKAAELTKGLTDDRARAVAIYDYVSTRVHYIGIDLGIGRYQSHAASEVLSNQYGDCKDKHTLLAALLEAVGIRAWPALISTSHDLDIDVPSPAQFDHVISAVWLGDQLTWLDTTPEVSPFAYLMSFLRGKNALLVSTDKAPALVITPSDPLTKPLTTFRIDAKLSDSGVLHGKIDRTVEGDDSEVALRAAFRSVPLPQWKDLGQQLSYASTFAGEVSDVTATTPEKTGEPFRFGYTYDRKDFPNWADRHVSSPLPPLPLTAAPEKDVRTLDPMWLGSPAEARFESHVELPKGYSAAPPANLDLVGEFAEYHRTYVLKDHILTTERRLILKANNVPVPRIDAYRQFVKAVNADQERSIPLSSDAAPFFYQSEIWDLPNSENADATRAYDDARDRIKQQDVPGAIAALKHAVELDPGYVRAWLWLGDIYRENKQSDEALEAYRKAVSIDPQQAVSYKALGLTLCSLRKYEEAIPVLQHLIEIAPNDRFGYEMLGIQFVGLKRYAEAMPLLEAALKLDPDAVPVRFQLGEAYLHSGDSEKAIVEYRKTLEHDPKPYSFNAVAYELAEADQQLPTALEFSKRAVTEEGAQSLKVDLSQLKREDLREPMALAADWDTLGWVHFKMGNLGQAEKYLNAAWALGQDATVADHLGQVYERQNKKPAAIHMYRIALDRTHAKTLSPANMDKIVARLERLSPGASNPGLKSGMEISSEVSQMRTTKILLPAKERASAEFFLLFSGTRLESAKFISGSETLKTAEAALKSTNFKISMPNDGDPRLLWRGVLYCSPLAGCSMTLMNPADVSSVN